MDKLLGSIFTVSLFFCLGCKLEDGWLGIKVFETRREEVEKRLGKPKEEDKWRVIYETDEALFQFFFSREPCRQPYVPPENFIIGSSALAEGFNVLKNTVLEYSIVPKKSLRTDEIEWDRKKYTRTEDTHLRNAVHYRNDKDGIYIEANNFKDERGETVRKIYFQRSADHVAKYRCKN